MGALSDSINRVHNLAGSYRSRREHGLITLGTSDGRDLTIRPEHFSTHALILAPTNSGKTYLVRSLIRQIRKIPAWKFARDPKMQKLLRDRFGNTPCTIFVSDPKGDLFEGLLEDFAATNDYKNLVTLDTRYSSRVLAMNPTAKNGLMPADHTLWILAAIRACWGQETFDRTPQLLRWLFNAILAVIEGGGDFTHALKLLSYDQVAFRTQFLRKVKDKDLRDEWRGYEALPITRKRDETLSAYARLKPFCVAPMIRSVISQPVSYNVERSFNGGVFMWHIPPYRPVPEDVTNLLDTLVAQNVVSKLLQIPLGERVPALWFFDEGQEVLARDPGIIRRLLDWGSSQGTNVVPICHHLTQIATAQPGLLASMITNCRTKILGGRLSEEDLQVLTPEFFGHFWHPNIVRNEIYSPFLMPHTHWETMHAHSEGGNEVFGRVLAKTLSDASGTGDTSQHGQSDCDDGTRQITTSVARNLQAVQSRAESESESRVNGRSWNDTYTPVQITEYERESVLSSQQLMDFDVFIRTYHNKLKVLPKRFWCIQPPEGDPHFFEAPFLKPVKGITSVPEMCEYVMCGESYVDVKKEEPPIEPEPPKANKHDEGCDGPPLPRKKK